jgi:predicted nucleic acid-binding protein
VPDLPPAFVIDANVLIDYADSDPSILSLFSNNIGTIHIITDVLEKVEQVNEKDCQRLGLVIDEPTIEQYLEAGQKTAGLAFDDKLCLITARDNQWTLISNDRALRSACAVICVPLLWGLEIMLPLVEKNLLPGSLALKTASRIHSLNPKFVHQEILTRFTAKIGKLKSKTLRKNIKN